MLLNLTYSLCCSQLLSTAFDLPLPATFRCCCCNAPCCPLLFPQPAMLIACLPSLFNVLFVQTKYGFHRALPAERMRGSSLPQPLPGECKYPTLLVFPALTPCAVGTGRTMQG
jgi:hypothetical protein